MVEFKTVFTYIEVMGHALYFRRQKLTIRSDPGLVRQQLKHICTQLNAVQQNAVIYLAAAVSDFYIPWGDLVFSTIDSISLRPL